MGGSSLPENVLEVFNPLMQWIDEYKNATTSTTKVEFSFEYLNTSSTNMVARLIEKIYELRLKTSVEFNWYYAHGDYDMKELGLDLLEEMDVRYNIIEVAA
jgi:hypothetical protein